MGGERIRTERTAHMEEVHPRLFVGDDKDYERVKDNSGWSFLRCCKEGPGGHRYVLKYHSLGAPKDAHYLWVRKGNLEALNLLDLEDPDFIPKQVIDEGLKFIKERMDAGDKVLVACNAGHSRGPTMALMYLREIGEYPERFRTAESKYRAFYPKYDPNSGMRAFARSHWQQLKDNFYGSV